MPESTIIPETSDQELSPFYSPDIQDFINAATKENMQPVFGLYVLSEVEGSKREKETFLTSFDFPPDPEWIQKNYCKNESLSFRVIGDYTSTKGKRIRKQQTMHISKALTDPGVPCQPVPMHGNGNGTDSLIKIMEVQNTSLMNLLNTVLVAALNGKAAAPAAPADPFQLQTTIGNIIKTGAENQMEVVNNMIAHKANELSPGSQDEPEETSFMVEFITGMLEKWGGIVLGGNKTEQKVFRKIAQKAPEFAQMEKNPTEYAAAYTEMIERGVEQDKLDAIIEVLGAPKPDLELVNA